MPNDNYANEPNNSRVEFIIQSILDGTEYDEPAQSRIEYLLKQLKAFIAELVTKGVSLIGETSTALVDNATTNPITVNGKSYTAQPNDAVIYGHKEFLFDGTKWHEFGDLSGLSSKDIGTMTNYVKAVTAADIDPTDTLNQAIGKLEKRVSDNENNISLINHAANTSLYFSETPPTGNITFGSYWISTSATKIYASTDIWEDEIEQGSWGADSLYKTTSTTRCRTSTSIPMTTGTRLIITLTGAVENAQFVLQQRNASGTTIAESGWQTSPYEVIIANDVTQMTVIMRKSNNDDCAPSDFGTLAINVCGWQ